MYIFCLVIVVFIGKVIFQGIFSICAHVLKFIQKKFLNVHIVPNTNLIYNVLSLYFSRVQISSNKFSY